MKYFVYVISEFTADSPRYGKVGIAENPRSRLSTLQTGNPRLLKPADIDSDSKYDFGIPVKTQLEAKKVEKIILLKLGELGVRIGKSEWFNAEAIKPDEVWSMVVRECAPYLIR